MSIRKLLLTIYFWLIASIATLAALLFTIINFILRQDYSHDTITYAIEKIMAPMIYYSMVYPGFWKVHFVNLYVNKQNKPQIIASNHNSMVDTLFIALLNCQKTYSYNYKYRFVPIFGQLCMLAGYIGIQTSNPEQKSKVVDQISKKMKEGYSMMIYPEGSRNKNPGSLLSRENVKTGAFRVALETNYPITPVYIDKSHVIMNRHGIIDVGTVIIYILESYHVENVRHGQEKFVEQMNLMIRKSNDFDENIEKYMKI